MAWCLRSCSIIRAGCHLRNSQRIILARRQDLSTISPRLSAAHPEKDRRTQGELLNPIISSSVSQPDPPRTFSTETSSHEVSYSEMQGLARDETNLIIDVREPSEREHFGYIGEASINIPLGELYSAFSSSDDDFKEQYNFVKPGKEDSNVILHCMSGVRSALARDIVRSTGYTEVRDYSGGWNEWSEKGNH